MESSLAVARQYADVSRLEKLPSLLNGMQESLSLFTESLFACFSHADASKLPEFKAFRNNITYGSSGYFSAAIDATALVLQKVVATLDLITCMETPREFVESVEECHQDTVQLRECLVRCYHLHNASVDVTRARHEEADSLARNLQTEERFSSQVASASIEAAAQEESKVNYPHALVSRIPIIGQATASAAEAGNPRHQQEAKKARMQAVQSMSEVEAYRAARHELS